MADNIVKIKFKAEGKELVDTLKKLDSIQRQLTQTQQSLVNVGKKVTKMNDSHVKDYQKHAEAQGKRNQQIAKLRRSLKALGSDFKKAGVSNQVHTDAIKGNRLALAKLNILTKRHITTMKEQQGGIFGLIGGNRLLGGSFAVLRSKLLLMSFAGTLVGSTIGRLARQFGVQEDAEKDLSTQLGHTNQKLLEQASELQRITTHGDEALLVVMRFASTLGIQEKNLFKVTKASIGLSEAYGIDLKQSTRMLANATSGNTEMLQRYIPELKNTKSESEKLALISEKVTEGFKLHIEKVGTLNFALDQMSNSTGDVAEKLGQVLAPAVIFSAEKMQEYADTFDEARVKRYSLIISSMATVFVGYRAVVIASTIANKGFSASLTKTGLGAIVVVAGVFIEKLLEMAGAFETVTSDSDNFNESQKITNKLTKSQIDNIEKLRQLSENRKKSIDNEITSLLLQEAELLDLDEIQQQYIKHGFEFVEDNRKKVESLIVIKKRVEELKEAEKEKLEADKQQARDKKKINDDLLKAEKKFYDDQKDARATVLEDSLSFQFQELELQTARYKQLFEGAEARLAIDEFERNKKRELATSKLEEDSALYNASLSSYDAFVQGMMDKDMNHLQTKQAMENAFKESLIRFLADLIKEQVKAFLIEKTIRKASDKATEKDAMVSGARIFASYSGAAKVKSLATSGANAISAGIATKAFGQQVDSMQKFEQGGLIGGRRHSQGGTVIEAEQGEFVMNRNAVESIGLEQLAQMNQTGSSGVTINIQGNMVGNEEFVRDTLIPEINNTVKQGLA